jgi:thiamine biosynthesis lipoprotein
MGSFAHVLVEADDVEDAAAHVAFATARLQQLERLWSRFVADSEVSLVNRSAGRPVVVGPETFSAIEFAVAGWRATSGRFDPCVLPALTAAGYDRSFEDIDRSDPAPPCTTQRGGCGDIVLDPVDRTVTLPADAAIDLGGVGKGLAADHIADELMMRGATATCVNLGGDIAARSLPEAPSTWTVGIAASHGVDEDGSNLTTIAIAEGGLATSAKTRRRWRSGDETWHHLIDPQTDRPTTNGLEAVTVLTQRAAWAEVLTKAAFVAGPDVADQVIEATGAAGMIVAESGEISRVGDFERFEV